MLQLDLNNIEAGLADFNARAHRELGQELFDNGLESYARNLHPQQVGSIPGATAASHAARKCRASIQHSRGLPGTFSSLYTFLLVLGSVFALRMGELHSSSDKGSVIKTILQDVAAACATLGVADFLVNKISHAVQPILLHLTKENASSLGAAALGKLLGSFSCLGSTALVLFAQLVGWLVAQWRGFFAEDAIERQAHKHHASDCLSLQQTIQSIGSVIGAQSIGYLLAGSAIFGAFGPALTMLMTVIVVVVIQAWFERATEDVERAGGFWPWIRSMFGSEKAFQPGRAMQYDGTVFRENEHLITRRLVCPMTKALVVNPVWGRNRVLYERDLLFVYLQEHHKDPLTGIEADPSCYTPSPTAKRLANEVANSLGASLTSW